tara:strand:+ start:82132 stop:83505 length:1374 start_codon:yes stop_codon:yes gene_type:complete
MWHTFWYMAKLSIVTMGALWLLTLEGDIVFTWDVYTVTAQTGFVLLLIAVFVVLVTWLTRSALFVESLPKLWRYYRGEKRREQSHVAVLRSLTALSAGDAKIAAYQAYRAQKLAPAEDGLALLLGAHAARLNGQGEEAEERFNDLIKNKETSLLGYQGLIKTACEQGEEQKALTLAYQAYDKNHKNKDFLPKIYEMETSSRAWMKALNTLRKMEKTGAMPKEKIKLDRAAILTQMGLEHKRDGQKAQAAEHFRSALKLSAGFMPAALELSALYVAEKQNKRAQKAIESQWRIAPHSALVKLWMALLPERKLKKPNARFEWVKRLASVNPAHIESSIAVAKIAMEDGLWGVAREGLLKAESLESRAAIYRMLEEITLCADHDEEQARQWADKAIEASSDPVWMCQNSGRIYPSWQLVAATPQDFNTITWRAPRRLQISGISSPYGADNPVALVNFMNR